MKIELHVWCQTNADQASGPGQKNRIVNLPVTRLKAPAVPATATSPAIPAVEENVTVFEGPHGSGGLTLHNVSKSFAAQLEAGKCYKLTLEEIA